jgi:hypothetical protein
MKWYEQRDATCAQRFIRKPERMGTLGHLYVEGDIILNYILKVE